MSWNYQRSEKRIREHLTTVPVFDSTISLAKHSRLLSEASLMDDLPTRRAFVVEGAHLYGQLLDFDTLVAERDAGETESSHANVLRFLSIHYQLWDSIIKSEDENRVDYHGARLHAVVTSPESDPNGQIQRAIALAAKLGEASKRVADAYGFPARVRFGIDHGRCVAMSTGRGHEKDTLFLGAPANHAAKAAAAGDEEGIFLASGAEQVVGPKVARKTSLGSTTIDAPFIREATERHTFPQVELVTARLIAEAGSEARFSFHRHTPPLSGMKFSDLSPNNSVRMGMASLFADIDGFTAFVDSAIRHGSDAIKQAASAVHVIREELNDVLKLDFEGKRVRFIGDCIQGVIGAGKTKDDPQMAIRETAFCASGMRSSFSLCQQIVRGIDSLDLAIGVEYGYVPITRLGQRSFDSVRCAAGRAVVVSEKVQQSIEGGGIRFGPTAQNLADRQVREHFADARTVLSYDTAVDLLGSIASPAVATVRDDSSARPHVTYRREVRSTCF